MQFKHRILLKIMGMENLGAHLKLLEEYWDEFRSRQFAHPDFPIKERNQFLREAGEPELTNFHLERFQLREQKRGVVEKIGENRRIVEAQLDLN